MDDSIFQKPSKYHTANGRKVFSGGGIMPDVFVPADTMGNTTLLYDLNNRQIFTAYALQKMQGILGRYATFDAFAKGYQVSQTELTNFIIYATKTLKQMDSQELGRSEANIKLYLKANAARFKWGDDAYYHIINQDDATLKKAVEVL